MGEASLEAVTTRIKDVTKIRGSSEYGVSGIGLVVGLAGDGDRNLAPTMQAFSNLLQRNNIVIAPEAIQSKNVAIVAVQAKISSRDKEGSMVDVIVSSMGDAKSLSGGTLMRTLLFGPDQTIAFATVQGTISVGGFNAGSVVPAEHPSEKTILWLARSSRAQESSCRYLNLRSSRNHRKEDILSSS
jgi:flagellar P-ring protein precursor FlgI